MKLTKRITIMAAAALFGLATMPMGALSVKITENGGTPTVCTGVGVVTCVTSDATFNIDVQTGTSNSPGPAQITINGTVNSASSGTNSLLVETSDTGFLFPMGPVTLLQTLNTNTPLVGEAPGTIAGTGYESNANTLFCQETSTCSAATAAINFGNFNVGNGTTSSVPAIVTAPFSLDEVLSYSFTGQGTALVTATLSVVPEPASLSILGFGLLALGTSLRKKLLLS